MRRLKVILQVICMVIGTTLLQSILYMPFTYGETLIINSNIIGLGTLYNIIYELIVNIIIIQIMIKYFNIGKLGLKERIDNSRHLMLFTCLLIVGYHNVYANTIGLLMNKIAISPWLTESFEGMVRYPIYALLSLCVFAPVFEEIVFRGIILKVLIKNYNVWTGMIISSILFATVHFNIHQGVNAMVVGMIISFVFVKTKSIRLCIFAHFFNNFYVLLEGYYEIGIESFVIGRLILGMCILIIGFGGFYLGHFSRYINQRIANR